MADLGQDEKLKIHVFLFLLKKPNEMPKISINKIYLYLCSNIISEHRIQKHQRANGKYKLNWSVLEGNQDK